MNWSNLELRGKNIHGIPGRKKGVSFTDTAGFLNGVKVSSENGRRTDVGKGARFTSRDCGTEGVKGFTPNGEPMEKNTLSQSGSKSKARKAASAEIAKIPPALAQWIAKCLKPKAESHLTTASQ